MVRLILTWLLTYLTDYRIDFPGSPTEFSLGSITSLYKSTYPIFGTLSPFSVAILMVTLGMTIWRKKSAKLEGFGVIPSGDRKTWLLIISGQFRCLAIAIISNVSP